MLDFEIKQHSEKTKYLQLANQIISRIEQGDLTLGEKLPSVNKFAKELNISRETVFKALNYLSERGIVYSKNRKGHFINKTEVKSELRIFLLLDKFTSFKDQLYHSLFETVCAQGEVDVFFHHHNVHMFESLIKENLQNYTHFVIVTFIKEDLKDILNLVPAEKRVILDCRELGLEGDYTMIYQNFQEDIFNALSKAQERLKKYDRLVLVASESLYHTEQVKEGFFSYCNAHNFNGTLVQEVNASNFKKGTVYIIISANETDITNTIKLSHKKGYAIGKDIGIISYNDTPIKEVLEGGITVISTDFESMGKTAAQLILNKETKILTNPTKLILRNSL